MLFDIQKCSAPEVFRLLTGGVLPRPIAWISTLDADGVANLAPYSFFTVACGNPPVLLFTHCNPHAGAAKTVKDTLRNLRETGECVVNVVSHAQAEAMNASCAAFAHGVSEFEAVGIEQAASHAVAAPGVAAAGVRYECGLREAVTVSEQPGGSVMVLLDVLAVSVDDALWQPDAGGICPGALDAVGKMGANAYALTRERFDMQRPAP